MAGPALYVYAIVGDPIALGDLTGITQERLVTIAADIGTCHAIAGEKETTTTAPAVDADTLRAQDALVRQLAARVDALLPARFGSRFADIDVLRQTLDELRPRLEHALARVRGCEQMTVRLFQLVTDKSGATITAPPVDPSSWPSREPSLSRSPSGSGPGTQYLLRRAAEARQAIEGIDILHSRLTTLTIKDERLERGRPPVIGSIHHLIPRGTADAYRAVLEEAGASAELAACGIRIRVSGPSPAYAFAEADLS